MSIAGTEAVTASGTVIVSTLEPQRAEHAVELLAPASAKMRFTPARAREPGTHLIGGVGIEPWFDRSSGQLQNLLPNGEFQGLQIQLFHRLAPQQALNLRNDVAGQQIAEEVFF